MRNFIVTGILGVIFFSATNSIHALNPVYSAQATADFNSNAFGNTNQGGNQGGNQNSNNNYGNNNGQYGNNNPAIVTGNGNNGGYVNTNNQPNYQNNNARNGNNQGHNNNGYSGNNNGNNLNNGNNWNNNNGNNQNYNNPNNNQNNNIQPNIFTENYALKGKQFSATVYRKDGNNQLYKTVLNSQDLQKAIVIFFGDWCPHCSRFLKNFSKNIPALTQAGVKIIFIGVPSVDRLQNWQEPTEADYTDNLRKLNGFGVQLGQNMELVLLGDSASLRNNAVDSLPTMMAISNSKECFRGGADNSIERAEFNNPNDVNQFLQVFNAFGNPQNGNNIKLITTVGNNVAKKINKNNKSSYYKNRGAIDISKTNMYTELLNDDCTVSCVKKRWTAPYQTQQYDYSTGVNSNQCPPCPACPPCPPCPASSSCQCPVCPKCATPIEQTTQYENGVNENPAVMSGQTGKCTTCGCIFRRMFSEKCQKEKKYNRRHCKKVKCCRKRAN